MTTRALLPALIVLSIGAPDFTAGASRPRDSDRASVRTVGGTVIVGDSDPLIWDAVLDLLPVRPQRIELLDLSSLQATARQRLEGLDAFVLTGQATIFVIRQSATLRQAELGDAFDRLVLASLLWHELGHANGLDEQGALDREQMLWRRFIGQGHVNTGDGMTYIARLREHAKRRRQDHAVMGAPAGGQRVGDARH